MIPVEATIYEGMFLVARSTLDARDVLEVLPVDEPQGITPKEGSRITVEKLTCAKVRYLSGNVVSIKWEGPFDDPEHARKSLGFTQEIIKKREKELEGMKDDYSIFVRFDRSLSEDGEYALKKFPTAGSAAAALVLQFVQELQDSYDDDGLPAGHFDCTHIIMEGTASEVAPLLKKDDTTD